MSITQKTMWNTQHFFWDINNRRKYSDAEIEQQNHERIERGIALGIGYFEVDEWEVRYYYDEFDKETYHVASLVGAACEGNDFDSFVLTAENGTEFVSYVYGISALGRTEEYLCRIFHDAVERYRAAVERGEDLRIKMN